MTVFRSGNLVVLKSGGPVMTVDAVNIDIFDDNKVTGIVCVWFIGGSLQRARFEQDAIEPAPSLCSQPYFASLAFGERERSTASLMWDIGDWWNRGQRYGERAQIVTAGDWQGPTHDTARVAGKVAKRWEVGPRN